jgi:hypothetical protein
MTYGHGDPPDPFGGNPFGAAPFDAAPAGVALAPPVAPREVNALATLSVIFAFVFAPAGAVLGHLGLAQIARTGQRGRERALVGVTLSYVVIAVAVVSLVVWLTIGPASTPSPTAAPPASAPPGPASTSASSSAPAPDAAGPTLTAIDPVAPLLNVDEMKAVLGTPANSVATTPVSVADLAAYPPFDGIDIALATQGKVSDPDCAATVFAGTGQAFGGLQDSIQGIQSVTMAQPGPKGTQSVTETAVVFRTSADADNALTHYVELLGPCKGRTVTLTTAPQGAVHTLPLSALGPHQYEFAGDEDPNAAGQQVYMFDQQSLDGFRVERGFLVKNNVLVDVSVRGLSLFADQQGVLSEILKKMS